MQHSLSTGSSSCDVATEPSKVLGFPVTLEKRYEETLEAIAASPQGQKAIIDMACKVVDSQWSGRGLKIGCFKAAAYQMKARMGHLEHEAFAVCFLDAALRVISFKILFRGTLSSVNAHPREIVKEVLAENAHAIILCHNHPTGDCLPSEADLMTTRRIAQALDTIEVRVLDHVIVGQGKPFSFAETGYL